MSMRQNLVLMRRQAGLTAQAVGSALGISGAAVSRYENGKRTLPNGLTDADYLAALERLQGKPERPTRTAFLMVPFDPQFTAVSRQIIQELVSFGIQANRADDFAHSRSVLQDIVASIEQSDLIIADLTGLNPNVMYELGLAHGRGRPVILITQSIATIPFDLRAYRVLEYSPMIGDFDLFMDAFRERIRQFIAGTLAFGSPVSDYLREPLSPIESGMMATEVTTAQAEAGILDHALAVQEGTEAIVEAFTKIMEATNEMGGTTDRATQFIQDATGDPDPRNRLTKLALGARLASDGLRKYRTIIAEIRGSAETTWDALEAGLEALIANGSVEDADTAAFEEIAAVTEDSRASLAGMRGAIAGTVGFDRGLNHEISATVSEIDLLLGFMDRMVSTFRRVHGLLKSGTREDGSA